MDTSNITNYKPKDFAESCRLYGLRKYKKQIERDDEIAKEFQDRNQSVKGTNSQNQ